MMTKSWKEVSLTMKKINSVIAILFSLMLFGVLMLGASSAQVADLMVDSFAKTDLVSDTSLSDVGFETISNDVFVREIAKPVGRVHIMGANEVKSCTGTLIREDIVLTASNCLPDEQAIMSANFRLGYLSEGQTGDAFSVETEPVTHNADLGYMLLKVDSSAVVNYGFLPLYIEEVGVGSSLMLVQHALSAPLSKTADCVVTATDGNLIEHNCQSAPGASGGLLFNEFGYPVAMHLADGLGINLLTLANSNKTVAEMYNLTTDTPINVDAISESAISESAMLSTASVTHALNSHNSNSESVEATTAEVADLAPVSVEATVTTTPLATSSVESGNNSVSNSSVSNSSSSLSAPAQVAWSVLAEGSQGSADEAMVYVIQSQAKLREVWTLANGNFTPMPTMPTVDFTNNTVIAVFLGIKPSGGHSVEIANMVNNATGLDVALQINEPGAGMFATMALTSPWVMIEVTGAPVTNLNVFDNATGAQFVSIIR